MNSTLVYSLGEHEFRIHRNKIKLGEILGEAAIRLICKKHGCQNEDSLTLATAEVIRFIYLSGISGTPLFFPGDKLMDDIWHTILLETAIYRDIAKRLGLRKAPEHSGTRIEDFARSLGNTAFHELQFSWLANYVRIFGKIEQKQLPLLPMARGIADRLHLNLEQLNFLAEGCLHAPQNSSIADIKMENISNVEEDRHLMAQYLRGKLRETKLSPDDLESLYFESVAAGFTAAQHFFAVERLRHHPEWIQKNETLWREIQTSKKLIGLATTHLRNRDLVIKGEESDGRIRLCGSPGWVSGIGIFDQLIVGFEIQDRIDFALIDFPSLFSGPMGKAKVTLRELSALNGTGTGVIEFNGLEVNSSQLLGTRPSNANSAGYPAVVFTNCDVGIGFRALHESMSINGGVIREPFQQTHDKIARDLELLRKAHTDPASQAAKHDSIRDAVRFLSIVAGGAALDRDHPASRLQAGILLLDIAGQTFEAKAEKCRRLSLRS